MERMTRILDHLEEDLKSIHGELEQQFMDLGRHGLGSGFIEQFFHVMSRHHEAWSMLGYQFDMYGPKVSLYGEKGELISTYNTSDAHTYVLKHVPWLHNNLKALALSCFELGIATSKGGVDDIKNASLAVARAREEIHTLWTQMRSAALRGV